MKWVHVITFLLTVLGGLNWGLISLFNLNLVSAVLGSSSSWENIVYVAIGVSAVYTVLTHRGNCKAC